MRNLALFLSLFFLAGLAGCSSLKTTGGDSLGSYRKYWVERLPTDNHRLGEFIVTELRRRGLQAEVGPLTMMPPDTEVIVNYQDHWAWEYKPYMISFGVTVKTARGHRPVASGSYYQPSLVTKPPAQVVTEVFARLFKGQAVGR